MGKWIMTDLRDTRRMVETYLESLPTPNGMQVDEKVLPDALTAQQRTRQQTARPGPEIWRIIMRSKTVRLAAAAVVVTLVFVTFFGRLTQPAWAFQDAIEAMKSYPAIHALGASHTGAAEIWIRANKDATRSTDVVVRRSEGSITWTRDGATYHYEPAQNTVYFEEAITLGVGQWLGPQLLETLATAQNTQIISAKDPATGRDRVILMASLTDVHGPQSFLVEFDATSRLPVTAKQWQNLDRSGPPSFEIYKIVYCEALPDSVFDVHIPDDAKHVEKPLEIPAEAVTILSDPKDGMLMKGMTQQEAAERTVRTLYQAVIDQDTNTLKSMSPLCRNWGDEFLRKIILKPDRDDRIMQILEIGQIRKTGSSPLGPIASVPVVVKLKNGKKVQEQMIVQFRELGGTPSCVVHGSYGLPREIE